MDKNTPIAYLNGEFIPACECKVNIFDLGVVLGASVTDFLRTFHQQPFRLEDHVARFYRSCRYAWINPPISAEDTMAASKEILEHNGRLWEGREIGLVYYATAGENAIYAGGAGISPNLKPTWVMHAYPMPFEIWGSYFTTGIHCMTPAPRHCVPQSLSSKIKHRNRLHMWIGEQEIHLADPKAMPVYLDSFGNLTETGGSNFVIYRDGKVISPKRNNILWGMSLQTLTEILEEIGIPFVEDDIQTYDVVNADEAWVPTTPYCLGPVTKFNGRPVGNGQPGPVWRKIIDHWSGMVGKDIYKELTEAVK